MSGRTQAEIAQRLARLAGAGVSELRLTGSQHQARHYRATLADGRVVFVKEAAAGPAGALDAEARGLGWLGGAGAVPVPGVAGRDECLHWRVPIHDTHTRNFTVLFRPTSDGSTRPQPEDPPVEYWAPAC